MSAPLREIRDDLRKLHSRVNLSIDQHLHTGVHTKRIVDHVELWVTDFVLARHWHKLGSELNSDDFTDAQAIAAVARFTGGNFRLLQRLFAQIHRILRINELHTITADVVETARSTLVVGAT
ncbi:ATP-binding protein [Rhodococcus zopfii]